MLCNRKTIRLKEYDYAQKGAYSVTICVRDRKCLFGNIENNEMVLNDVGRMIEKWWQKLPDKYDGIEIDEYRVMPNHMHGIIRIVGAPLVGALKPRRPSTMFRAGTRPFRAGTRPFRAGTRPAPTLGNIIGAFKSMSTNEYIRNVKNNDWQPFNKRLWQRNYYEHIVRDEMDLTRIREYIITNPAKWEEDEYYLS